MCLAIEKALRNRRCFHSTVHKTYTTQNGNCISMPHTVTCKLHFVFISVICFFDSYLQSTFTDPLYRSFSSPIHTSTANHHPNRGRARRHTITRTDSAMVLLSDMEEEEEEEEGDAEEEEDEDDVEQKQAFDRISSILTNLIQEANDAVHDIEEERVHLLSNTNHCRNKYRPSDNMMTMSRRKKNHQRVYPSFSNVTSSHVHPLWTANVPVSKEGEFSIAPSNSNSRSILAEKSGKKNKVPLQPPPPPTVMTAKGYVPERDGVPSPPYSPVEACSPTLPLTSVLSNSMTPHRTVSTSFLTYPTRKRQFRYTSPSRSASQLVTSSTSRRSISIRLPRSTTLTLQRKRQLSLSTHNNNSPYTSRMNPSRSKDGDGDGDRTSGGGTTTDVMLKESFQRLDSSMALIDSLSKDLAASTDSDRHSHTRSIITNRLFGTHTTTTFTIDATRLTVLILVPLLHIPHSLITMMFDFCFYYTQSPTTTTTTTTTTTITTTSTAIKSHIQQQQQQQQQQQLSSSPFNLSSMLLWACVFAITNFMVDQVAVITPSSPAALFTAAVSNKKNHFISRVRRLSTTLLPGTSKIEPTEDKENEEQSKKRSTTLREERQANEMSYRTHLKRTWVPISAHQQKSLFSDHNSSEGAFLPVRTRRNSI
ncbi:hypothetical protein BDF20DRAFT_929587 [Mycotypha africana]|uniref:uncharacterized protein n=1 Tax=Mycotypha africana TaxID=64632 RepID=UPI0022FFF84F|nr:uncharacterized protein BDF20DRAFT_929587 [Mycotypha africana]KAI8987386.1 hypothetical protein BDF20DRAFT_929587 [Mycotypha africana]